jgi:hypothetical protein
VILKEGEEGEEGEEGCAVGDGVEGGPERDTSVNGGE